MLDSRCRICSDHGRRQIVDDALRSGLRPSEVFARFGDTLGVSRSGVYRHASSHQPPRPLTTAWTVEDTSLGEAVDDARLVRDGLRSQYIALRASGADAIAIRAAAALTAATDALLRVVPDETVAQQLSYTSKVVRAVNRATLTRPAFADEVAEAARKLGMSDLESDAHDLREQAERHAAATAAPTTEETHA